MKTLSQFSLPYKGMGVGLHQFRFDVDSEFFSNFEDSAIKNGNFIVDLDLEKKSDHSILNFEIKGHTRTTCDRCLADIDLPILGEYTLHLKFSEEEYGDDTEEIIFLHPETSVLNVAEYVYEYITLSLPMVNTFDCDPETDCNQKVLEKLELIEDLEKEEEETKGGGIWDSLKDLEL